MEEGATSHGMKAASRYWKRQGNRLHPRTPRRRHSPADSLIFSLIYVPLKFMCWSPNPQDLRIWLYLETGSLKRQWGQMRSLGWDLTQYDWPPNKRERHQDSPQRGETTWRHRGKMATTIQGEKSQKKTALTIPWSWTSSFHNHEIINFCRSCCPFCPWYGSLSKPVRGRPPVTSGSWWQSGGWIPGILPATSGHFSSCSTMKQWIQIS